MTNLKVIFFAGDAKSKSTKMVKSLAAYIFESAAWCKSIILLGQIDYLYA